MIDHRATGRYSRALFGLAEKAAALKQTDADLEAVCLLVEKHAEITNLVANSTISRPEKEDFISKILPPKTSSLVLHFIKILIKKKRFRELVAIQRHFRKLYEKQQGLQEVVAVTVETMSDANEKRLVEMLAKKLKAEIRLVKEVDPRIIGGLIVRFNGTEIDASYQSRLAEVKQKLKASIPR
ncbi:MAG: ATP synthase F1 subunit delta [Candidatus Omnitrophota bacterium]|nr:ATP synthase F1 subunit delta [Candidatus Omnitrophota bacterium]